MTLKTPYFLENVVQLLGYGAVCYRENIAMLPYSPLAGGILSGKYLDGSASPSTRFNDWGGQRQAGLAMTALDNIIQRYVDLAREHGLDPVHMTLSFVTNRFFVDSNIINATTMAQLKTCLQSTEVNLFEALLMGIDLRTYMQVNSTLRYIKRNIAKVYTAIAY